MRLLFLAHYFPPARSAGMPRARSLAEYLSRLGWQVTVVTPDPSLWTKPEETDATEDWMTRHGIRRLPTGMRSRWRMAGIIGPQRRGIPGLAVKAACRAVRSLGMDRYAGWKPEIESACRTLAPGDVDVILATGSPFVAFRAARGLSERLGAPFVIDYRDPWTDNPHRSGFLDWVVRRHEDALLQDAAAVTAVSDTLAEMLRRRVSDPGRIHVVSNGYDPAHLRTVRPAAFGHFAIVYAGQFYPPKRSVLPLLEALRRLEERRPDADWRFHSYGPHGAAVRDAAAKTGLERRVIDHGVVPRSEALAAVRGAGVAVVIASVLPTASQADRCVVPGKVFEAIGSEVPILAIAPPGGDLERVVADAGRGRTFVGTDHDGIVRYLETVMRGQAPPTLHPERYGWPSLANEMDAVLRKASGAAERG